MVAWRHSQAGGGVPSLRFPTKAENHNKKNKDVETRFFGFLRRGVLRDIPAFPRYFFLIVLLCAMFCNQQKFRQRWVLLVFILKRSPQVSVTGGSASVHLRLHPLSTAHISAAPEPKQTQKQNKHRTLVQMFRKNLQTWSNTVKYQLHEDLRSPGDESRSPSWRRAPENKSYPSLKAVYHGDVKMYPCLGGNKQMFTNCKLQFTVKTPSA